MSYHRDFIIGILIIFASGCAVKTQAHFQSFPREQAEFEHCPEELHTLYSDIDHFDGPFSKGAMELKPRPHMKELVEVWGEPDSKQFSLWNTAPLLVMLPFGLSAGWVVGISAAAIGGDPANVYVWQKGRYTIKCVVLHPIGDSYEPHIFYWRWYYNGPACTGEPTGSVLRVVREQMRSDIRN